jgi:hypothetical protein
MGIPGAKAEPRGPRHSANVGLPARQPDNRVSVAGQARHEGEAKVVIGVVELLDRQQRCLPPSTTEVSRVALVPIAALGVGH